jgi:hypothetical protein
MRYLLLVLIVAFLACGGDDCIEVGVIDEGFHVAEDGVELHPGMLPAAFAIDTTVEDVTLLPEVLDQWNVWLSRDGTVRTVLVVAEPEETPRVLVSVGFVPAPDWGVEFSDFDGEGDPLGIARLDYAEDGEVLGAEIVLSSDVAYDRDTLVDVLAHEAGHFLALADDPGPPETVDLRSAMASPMDPLGELTEHDFELLQPYLP